MFDSIKKRLARLKTPKQIVIRSPIQGTAAVLSEVNDPTFSEEWLGKGVAIHPARGRVVAPFDGVVKRMFATGHAVSLVSSDGVEVLVHIGLDTINLNGKHYAVHVRSGDRVKSGDLLVEFDLSAIVDDGFDPVSLVVVCNSPKYAMIDTIANTQVGELEKIIRLTV